MKTSHRPLKLVAGAAGTQGGAVIDALLARNVNVRGIVRNKNSEAAQALAAKNVELVEATFDDLESLINAAKGATAVFSMQMGSHPGNKGAETRHARNLVAAAKAAGIQQIVHTSVARAGDHKNFVDWEKGRWEPAYWEEKAAAINAVKDAGFLYWTIIKPPLIMENLLPSKSQMMYPTIAQGKLITPLDPEVKLDWVSPNDIGRFAAEAFLQPEKFNRKEFAIVGDKLSLAEVADVLSAVTGKQFEAQRGTPKDAIVPGFFELWVQSYEWQEVEGYKVDPQEAADFGIRLESLKTYLEKNKSVLQDGYGGLE